jgi:predicted metalloprotease with PDZ domain
MASELTGKSVFRPTYRLSWTAEQFPTVYIDADIEVEDGRLSMFPGLGWTLGEQRGFAAYVNGLSVRDTNDRALEVVADDSTGWNLPGFQDGRVAISYSVDLSFATRTFSTGNEQVALLDGDALYLTGYSIFVASGNPTDIRIEIEAPPSWQVVTAWKEVGPGHFIANDYNDLIRNLLAVGKGFYSETLQRNGVELRLALFGQHQQSAATVRSTLLPIMDYFANIFRNTDGSQFAIALLPGPNDGEGFSSSFASSQPGRLEETEKMVWANSLAHEFFHHWNGSRISSAWEHYPERQWFSEGFTEYYANRALLATGVIDQRTYDEIVSQYLSMHSFFATSSLFGDVSLRDAGEKKGLYRPGVYDSGVAVAFCLDGMLRTMTEEPKTLDDFMRAMDRKFGQTGIPVTLDDILDTADAVGPAGTRTFLEAHVVEREQLPIENCAMNMGYRAIVDGYHIFLRRR